MCSSSTVLTTRSLKTRVGTAAKAGASAPTTSKFRSGIQLSFRGLRFCPKVRKELLNRFPGLLSPAQTFPGNADQADKLITSINWDDVMLTCVLHTIDKQRLDVGLQVIQDRIAHGQCLPFLQVKHGLHSSRRT